MKNNCLKCSSYNKPKIFTFNCYVLLVRPVVPDNSDAGFTYVSVAVIGQETSTGKKKKKKKKKKPGKLKNILKSDQMALPSGSGIPPKSWQPPNVTLETS